MITGYIYGIQCKVNYKWYIGQSIKFWSRWGDHRRGLRQGLHKNVCLQADYNKYGPDAFYFHVINICEEADNLDTCEQFWIDFLHTINPTFGYNLVHGGVHRRHRTLGELESISLAKFMAPKTSQRIAQQKKYTPRKTDKLYLPPNGKLHYSIYNANQLVDYDQTKVRCHESPVAKAYLESHQVPTKEALI